MLVLVVLYSEIAVTWSQCLVAGQPWDHSEIGCFCCRSMRHSGLCNFIDWSFIMQWNVHKWTTVFVLMWELLWSNLSHSALWRLLYFLTSK